MNSENRLKGVAGSYQTLSRLNLSSPAESVLMHQLLSNEAPPQTDES